MHLEAPCSADDKPGSSDDKLGSKLNYSQIFSRWVKVTDILPTAKLELLKQELHSLSEVGSLRIIWPEVENF